MLLLSFRSCHKLGVESFERMLGEVDEDVWSVAVGNDNLDAGIGNLVGCLHLRLHATSAHAALISRDILADVAVVVYRWDDASVRILRVAIVYTIHIRE